MLKIIEKENKKNKKIQKEKEKEKNIKQKTSLGIVPNFTIFLPVAYFGWYCLSYFK